jgi:hypothetical protein
MHDHFSELFEWDEDGKRPRRKRVAQDREQIHFPMTVMDHAAFGLRETFSDGSPDFTDPHRPGFRFDTKDSAKLAADASYREMVARLDYRHRQQDGASDHGSQRTLDADALERAAADAYEFRSERMRTAWKNHA